MAFATYDEATRWAHARKITPKVKARLRELERWHWSQFFETECSITYHKCRFCKRGHPEVKGLWKYAVRHWICDDCRKTAIER